MEGETYHAVKSAAARTVKGAVTYEEFLTIFESHNRAYLNDVRELLGGTAQTLLERGQLTPESIFDASQKHPWALGYLGLKTGSSTQEYAHRVEKLEQELAAARTEVAATKLALRDALIELDGEYAIAEARATAAVQKAQENQLAAAEMIGHSSSGSTIAAPIVSTTAPQVGNPSPGPRTSAADLSFVSSQPPAPVVSSALRNSSHNSHFHLPTPSSKSGAGSQSNVVGSGDASTVMVMAAQSVSASEVQEGNARSFLESDEAESPSVGGFT